MTPGDGRADPGIPKRRTVGRVSVDLGGCVDEDGVLGERARFELWCGLAECPPGAAVRIDAGGATAWSLGFAADLGALCAGLGCVEIIGRDPALIVGLVSS